MFQKTPLRKLSNSMSKPTSEQSESGGAPKKPKAKKKSEPVKVKPPQSTPVPANQAEALVDAQIAQVIKDAIRIHLIQSGKKRQQVEEELDAMVATCQEFMKSFVILGYDMSGSPVDPIIYAHNQQEADALGNYLQKFLQHIARNDGHLERE